MSSAETYFLLIGVVIGALAAAVIVLVAYYLAGQAPPHSRSRALLMVVLVAVAGAAGCSADPVSAPAGPPVCAPTPTTIAVTSPQPGAWAMLDAQGVNYAIYLLGSTAPFDTARVAAESTLVYGYRLDARGFPRCHDYHLALPGDVVTLACEPTPAGVR